MRKIGLAGLIIVSLLFGCKKESKEASGNKSAENSAQIKNISGNSDNQAVLEKMQADIPQREFPLIDANLTGLDGKNIKLSDYKGKVILLNLWATWCPPCRAEMPSMEQLYKAYKDKDFVIVAVSVGEEKKTVTDFLAETPYSFPIYLDLQNEISANYSTGSIPTTYLIDKKGILAARFIGGRNWYSEDAKELVEVYLAQ